MRTADKLWRAMMLALVLVIAVFGTGLMDAIASNLTDSEQEKIEGYRNEKAALDEQIRENNEKMAALKDSIEEQEAYARTLQDQIDAYQRQIDVQNLKIDELEAQKAELQAEIDALQVEIDELEAKINHIELQQISLEQDIEDTIGELKDTLRDLYVYGRSSELELLLNSSDFMSFLISLELMDNKTANADTIVSDLNAKYAQLEDLKSEQAQAIAERESDQAVLQSNIDTLNAREAEIESTKAEIEYSQSQVQDLMNTAMKYLAELEESSAAYKAIVESYEAQKAALDDEIESIIAEAERRAIAAQYHFTPSGNYILPLLYSDVYLSSGYGYRNISGYYSTFHGGVDLCCWSGTYGKTVSATAAGVVIYSGFNGYGNCVMIDHGGGVVSLYGHMASRAVYEGETVYQGQTVGYAGNTYGPGGYSTGPHLHFEIRVNGAKVNPGAYVALP
ncbi:MAG: peptidoglycan DD-metalloendopeptidase family protein [Clostridia bacterium]|nr:peptidoglycan DD-metalloendopeptidase family protein [Clostridia bacterium]